MGQWGFVESFIDDVKLKEFPSKSPSLSVSPWNKSSLVFSVARIRATAQNLCSI